MCHGGGSPFALEPDLGPAPAYRLFDVRVRQKVALSPSLLRITFHGEEVSRMRLDGADQRIRIFFPDAFGRAPALPHVTDWLQVWRDLPASERPPQRTFTLRALRREAGEFDVDFFAPCEFGPATTWARLAAREEGLQVAAPDGAFDGDCQGHEWRPPATPERLLLVADQTALPAVAAILEDLAAQQDLPPPTEVFVEMADMSDRIDLPAWCGLRVIWLARKGAPCGVRLIEAAHRAELPPSACGAPEPMPDIDADATLLWDRASPREAGFYAWIAGEAGVVKEIRRVLVSERGLQRVALTATGYWRLGRTPFDDPD